MEDSHMSLFHDSSASPLHTPNLQEVQWVFQCVIAKKGDEFLQS